MVLPLNNNLRNMKNKFNQPFKFKTYTTPYKISTKKQTRKVNSLSSKHLKVTGIGPMILLLLFLFFTGEKKKKTKDQLTFFWSYCH